jgi:hypothetical protein
VRHWRSGRDAEVTFALVLIATLVISPHTSVYDLALLTPALMILADRLLAADAREGRVDKTGWVLIASTFLLPLLPRGFAVSPFSAVRHLPRVAAGPLQWPVASLQFPVASSQSPVGSSP